jgi:tetratricopeptide (TPR) repeat protein
MQSCLLKLGRTEEALADARLALQLDGDGDSPRFKYVLAQALLASGRIEEAKELAATFPNNEVGFMVDS